VIRSTEEHTVARKEQTPTELPLALAITGASGAPYWRRLLQVVLMQGIDVHLVCSAHADSVCRLELSMPLEEVLQELSAKAPGKLHRFERNDFYAPMASGSARYRGMAIVPCSTGTLGRIAAGTSDGLTARAADVMLKEKRRLLLLVRETPFSLVHLENMRHLARAGATIMPASPGFYQQPREIGDLVDFVVQRICDQLEIPCELQTRWGADEK
jgi:4-hydroxy-3-polyprenylbenzoate decarboxylase